MLWDIEAGSKVTEFSDHNGDVMSVSINPQVGFLRLKPNQSIHRILDLVLTHHLLLLL